MDAVIFDLDGTIVDTEGVHADALDEVVRARGLRGRAEGYVGLTDFQALELIFQDHDLAADPGEMRALVNEKTALVVERLEAAEIRVYDGAIELVTACAEVAPVAICTASASHEAKRALHATGLLEVASALITCCDVTKNKPDPEGYRLAADRLGVEAGGTIAIEDSRNGLAAAKAAGLFTVALRHTCPEDHLLAAHRIVDKINDLSPSTLADMLKDHNGNRDRQGADQTPGAPIRHEAT